MMVMAYAQNGSLRQHLNNSFNSLNWNNKLESLKSIAAGLDNIHEKGLLAFSKLLTNSILRCYHVIFVLQI